MYSMYFVFSYFICPVYCSIDTNACQYVRIKKLLLLHKLDDDEDEEGEDDDVTSIYSFKTLYNLIVVESEHITSL